MPAELLSTRGPPPPPTHQLTERRCYLIYLSRLLLRVSSSLVYWKEGGKEKGDVFIQHKLLTTRGVYRAHRLQLQQLGIRDEGHFVSLRHRKWIFRVWPVFRWFAGRTLYTYTRKKEKKHKASETGGFKRAKETGRRESLVFCCCCYILKTLSAFFFFGGGTYSTDFYDDNCCRDAPISPLSPLLLLLLRDRMGMKEESRIYWDRSLTFQLMSSTDYYGLTVAHSFLAIYSHEMTKFRLATSQS